MSEIKQRPVRDPNPNENTKLLENNTKIEYMSVTNRKRPVLDSNPNEIMFDSNTNENILDSNPNETTRQPDNYDIEQDNGLDINTNNDETSMQPHKVCMNSDTKICKNKWPPPF